MLKRVCMALAVLIVPFAVQAQKIVLSGKVIDKQTREAITRVHVYAGSVGTVTNEEGRFQINIDHADTIVFSSIGYSHYSFQLKEYSSGKDTYEVLIEMEPKTYELKEIEIRGTPTYAQFKQQVVELNIPTPAEGMTIEIPTWYKLPADRATIPPLFPEGEGFGVKMSMGPVYDKQKMQRDAYLKSKKKWETIDRKYNLEVIQQVTKLTAEEAKEFMSWCKFENSFILETSEYDLAVAMLDCLKRFKEK